MGHTSLLCTFHHKNLAEEHGSNLHHKDFPPSKFSFEYKNRNPLLICKSFNKTGSSISIFDRGNKFGGKKIFQQHLIIGSKEVLNDCSNSINVGMEMSSKKVSLCPHPNLDHTSSSKSGILNFGSNEFSENDFVLDDKKFSFKWEDSCFKELLSLLKVENEQALKNNFCKELLVFHNSSSTKNNLSHQGGSASLVTI